MIVLTICTYITFNVFCQHNESNNQFPRLTSCSYGLRGNMITDAPASYSITVMRRRSAEIFFLPNTSPDGSGLVWPFFQRQNQKATKGAGVSRSRYFGIKKGSRMKRSVTSIIQAYNSLIPILRNTRFLLSSNNKAYYKLIPTLRNNFLLKKLQETVHRTLYKHLII